MATPEGIEDMSIAYELGGYPYDPWLYWRPSAIGPIALDSIAYM